MKIVLLIISICLISININSQNDESYVEPDVLILKSAGDYSKTGEIGLFIIAGNEYDSLTNEQIEERFDKYLSKTNIGIKTFVQRTDKRYGSSYGCWVDGNAVGGIVGIKGLAESVQKSIDQYRRTRNCNN